MNNTSSVESRLRALEDMLRGGSGGSETDGPGNRIRALEGKLDAFAADSFAHGGGGAASAAAGAGGNNNPSLKQLWDESDKLMRELNPGSALTHQQQIAAPILYRRQEVLASSESLHRNMQQVMEILTLLSIGQPQMISNDSTQPVSEMQVTKAPILTQTTPPPKEEQDRLRQVEKTIADVNQQMESIATRMDRLVNGYHSLVSVVSEKMVLADEVVAARKGS